MISKLLSVSALAFLISSGLSSPLSINRRDVEQSLQTRTDLKVLKTTVTNSHTIDWVAIESQGDIASPPPAPAALVVDPSKPAQPPKSELQLSDAQHGPEGTVPIPRVNSSYLTATKSFQKSLPPLQPHSETKRQYSGVHWYCSSDQSVSNLGGSAVYSIFGAFVESSGDFSLLQTAVTKGSQTIEAGWINYPDQVSQPHLFTFFTTNGYSADGDNIGGWNQDQQGWVQVDSTYFPGTVFSPESTIGGDQYEITLQYQLYEGNWWLYVIDRWMGYYPASLFSAGQTGDSLATGSDTIFYYGEIYNSEAAETTTDMGSGEFASGGFGQSAYIHNMVYLDTNSASQDYTAGFFASDDTRYNYDAHLSSGEAWASYVYLGGPGAGGVVGG